MPSVFEGTALQFHCQTRILKRGKSRSFELSGVLSLTDGDINLLAQAFQDVIVRSVFLQRSQFCFKGLKSACFSVKPCCQSIQSAFQTITTDCFCIPQTDRFFQRCRLSSLKCCEAVLFFGGLSALFRKLGVFLFLRFQIRKSGRLGGSILCEPFRASGEICFGLLEACQCFGFCFSRTRDVHSGCFGLNFQAL
ncbi:hypothetical protein AA3271_1323 [Gluconobacter japonicus NBRC 3271]|nr:hypothetical protein AA3271_1323 [Gluconobacter japonicus NBRC 3271]